MFLLPRFFTLSATHAHLWCFQEEEYLKQLLERRARERYIQKERNELQKQLKVSDANDRWNESGR